MSPSKAPWGQGVGRGVEQLEAPGWVQEIPLSAAQAATGIAGVTPPLQLHSGVPVFQEEEPAGIAFDSGLTASYHPTPASPLAPTNHELPP